MGLPITIPVFVHNDESRNLEDLGMDSGMLNQASISHPRIYRIDAIDVYPHEGDGEYTIVYTGGMPCISPWSMQRIQDLIENDTPKLSD